MPVPSPDKWGGLGLGRSSTCKNCAKTIIMNESRNNKDRVRMSPLSDPQIHHPITVAQQGLPHCEWVRIKKLVQECRVGTLNIGTMTGKGRA
jgi:hypothetical protein